MIICGLDECGRGPLAGPIVAAAVILNPKFEILNSKLDDSKKLSPKQRLKFYRKIIKSGAVVAVEQISVRQINFRGIGWANKEVFKKLIKRIQVTKYIVDGNLKIKVRGKSKLITSIVKADNKFSEVMAASIVAKVSRDRIMDALHEQFPDYGWQSNKGYGTKYHIAAIREHGVTKYHRSKFVGTALN